MNHFGANLQSQTARFTHAFRFFEYSCEMIDAHPSGFKKNGFAD